jgi:hypothetical protein
MKTPLKFLSAVSLITLIFLTRAQALQLQVHQGPIPDSGEVYDALLKYVFGSPVVQSPLTYVPNGADPHPLRPECRPYEFERQIMRASLSTQEQYKRYQDFFKECGTELSANAPTGLLSLLIFTRVAYDINKNANIQQVTLHLKDGTLIPALFAIKDRTKKRPFIIVRCGLTCDGDGTPTNKSYLINLFDSSPFNILILGSHTGPNVTKMNHALYFGGYNEALEMVETADWLKSSSEYKDLIS